MMAVNIYDVLLFTLSRIKRAGDRAKANAVLLSCEPVVDALLELGLIRRGTSNAMAKLAGTQNSFFLTVKGSERLWTLGFCYRGTSSPQWRKRRGCSCGFGQTLTADGEAHREDCTRDTQWNMVSVARKKSRQERREHQAVLATRFDMQR